VDTATAERQLDRVMGFFPRVDNKASALFAINSTMLGVLAARLDRPDLTIWYSALCAALVTVGVVYSFAQLYICAYPHLKGGGGSYVYFQAIAKRTEQKFSDEFKALDDELWLHDVSRQVWRNSEILSIKFSSLKHAFIATLAALAPWTLAVFFTGM
jgi:hypothetical protein